MMLALAGNQNCGKTTLFNQLTGSNQHVGNFPGVTVEQKTGALLGKKGVSVVDLPGIYSLSPYSGEEIVTRDFLLKQKPDAIINIVDATNIERNLYLTLQLIELQIPMVLALNMMDEIRANNARIHIEKLQDALGIPIVPISAIKKEGLSDLTDQSFFVAQNHKKPSRIDFCSGAVHRAVHAIAHLIEDHAERADVPVRFAATKLVEGDEPMLESLDLSDNEKDMLAHTVTEMETALETDREAALADMRYHFIEEVCAQCVIKRVESNEYRRSVKLDKLLTHKILAIPTFLVLLVGIFFLTFNVIGAWLSDGLMLGVDYLTAIVDRVLVEFGLNTVIHSLIIDGIFAGVGAVLSFVPIIVTLFFFLSMLEDSGYMARVAFIMDKPLRKIGLSGRSVVPMLMGFGCTVPAAMAARTLPSERDRKMTILLTPFMSCSAKVPIYALFSKIFFPRYQALVMISLYVIGILLGVVSGVIMSKTFFKGTPAPFVMELPNYRFPSPKTLLLLMWDKAKDFLQRAFTVIFIATVVIWFFQSFDIRLNPVIEQGDSILAAIGRWISPVFAPVGFSDWRVSTALITGFAAKEAVISSLAVLSQGEPLNALFSPLSAYSFLVFTLLYTPCVAAVSAIKREFGHLIGLPAVLLYQLGVAWLAAFVLYQVGCLL